MQVERVPLPGTANVVVLSGSGQRALVDWTLSRDEAALALQGVLPHVHSDVIDHWLDTAYPRRVLPFAARSIAALGLSIAVMALPYATLSVQHHVMTGRRQSAAARVLARAS